MPERSEGLILLNRQSDHKVPKRATVEPTTSLTNPSVMGEAPLAIYDAIAIPTPKELQEIVVLDIQEKARDFLVSHIYIISPHINHKTIALTIFVGEEQTTTSQTNLQSILQVQSIDPNVISQKDHAFDNNAQWQVIPHRVAELTGNLQYIGKVNYAKS